MRIRLGTVLGFGEGPFSCPLSPPVVGRKYYLNQFLTCRVKPEALLFSENYSMKKRSRSIESLVDKFSKFFKYLECVYQSDLVDLFI